MKDTSKKSSKDIRKQHNSDLLRRMRNGESLTSFDSRASWFPPRPIIKKDEREIARLYQTAPKSPDGHESRPAPALNVVTLDKPARSKPPLGEAS